MVPKSKLIPKKRVRLQKPRGVYYVSTSREGVYRGFVDELPTKTLAVTMYALRWILFFVLVYIVISTTVMFFTESYSFLQQIVTLSIGGFFGFFMGYFGWVFAHHITTWLTGKGKEDVFDGFQF
ncbi:MAG TPA: hypothetical protein ENI42_02700 [Thermoplasmatales archaeon]|nr:hypothetical protein [Thermoplasmatales archaeon]